MEVFRDVNLGSEDFPLVRLGALAGVGSMGTGPLKINMLSLISGYLCWVTSSYRNKGSGGIAGTVPCGTVNG